MRSNPTTLVILALSVLSSQMAVWGQTRTSAIQDPSTSQQIEFLQQQIDELRLQTLSASGSETPIGKLTPPNTTLPTYDLIPQQPTNFVPPSPPAKPKPDVRLTGFFQLDTARFGQSTASTQTLGDIQDGTGFRRARLAAVGNVSERTSYQMEFDWAQAQARFVDVWGQVKDTPFGTMRIGRFRQPFGMSELTGVRELPLLERPTSFAMSPFRQTGVMFSDTALNESATWAVSGFRTFSDNFGNVFGDDGGYGTAERLTLVAIDNGDCGIVHLGAGHSYLDPARNQLIIASQDEVFVGQQPNFGPGGLSVSPIVFVPPFVNTGVFDVEHANLFNIEFAASMGHALVQSEYRWTKLELPSGQTTTVQAGYATVRYMLTGEVIPYNRSSGVFGRVQPSNPVNFSQGNWGAWEVVGRVSNINLNPLFGLPGVPGPTRRMVSSELGLNWYCSSNTKCQIDWINAGLNDRTLGNSVTNTLAARFQLDF